MNEFDRLLKQGLKEMTGLRLLLLEEIFQQHDCTLEVARHMLRAAVVRGWHFRLIEFTFGYGGELDDVATKQLLDTAVYCPKMDFTFLAPQNHERCAHAFAQSGLMRGLLYKHSGSYCSIEYTSLSKICGHDIECLFRLGSFKRRPAIVHTLILQCKITYNPYRCVYNRRDYDSLNTGGIDTAHESTLLAL